MKASSLKNLTLLCACLVLGPRLASAETNAVPEAQDLGAMTQSVVNGYLQIQAQLHDAQIAIEASRREMVDEAKRNTDALTARIQTLEATIATQRARPACGARATGRGRRGASALRRSCRRSSSPSLPPTATVPRIMA